MSVKSSELLNANVIKECPEKCQMLVGISFPVLEKLFKYLCSDLKVSSKVSQVNIYNTDSEMDFVKLPSSLMARAELCSHYKRLWTIKVLISCIPLGAINHISKCYGGKASDIQITRESGFATSQYHMPADQILAGRGFTLKDDFAAGASAELLIAAFTRGKSPL